MWDQYKKSLWGMQMVIALVTGALYLRVYGSWQPTLTFFVFLQMASVLGAYWAMQIRKKRLQSHV